MYFPRVYRALLTINSLQIFVKTRTFEIFHFLSIDSSVIRFSNAGQRLLQTSDFPKFRNLCFNKFVWHTGRFTD